jgi:hypothetical protein
MQKVILNILEENLVKEAQVEEGFKSIGFITDASNSAS